MGADITWEPRTWLTTAIRERGARTLASPAQAGVDFTLFQCADALVAMVGGVAAGWLAQHLGYGACFGIAAALGAAGLPVLSVLMRRAAPLSSSGE